MSARSPALLLERALMATWLMHGLGMVSMALVLLPMMPGGSTTDVLERVALIATHRWLFRAGWIPWHLTAASDLFLAYAFLRTAWIPRAAAWGVMLLTVMAIVPDQGGQLLWDTRGIELALRAHASGDLAPYLAYEAKVFPMTGVWAALLYTVAALGWTACLALAGAWSRTLTWTSVITWGTFFVVTIGPLLPAPLTLPGRAIAIGNAVGFLLLMIWIALATEVVMQRTRATSAHGRWAPWRAPRQRSRLLGAVANVLANSRFARALCMRLPVFAFRSDITDVIYVNYLVEVSVLETWVPEGLELQRLGPSGGWAMFTHLTYRHGHFGPALLGPLRRLMSSPVQSNWRTYVRDPRTGLSGIYFVTNAVTTWIHSLGARMMAEGMPMHLLASADVARDGDRVVRLALDAGDGSAVDASAVLRPAARPTLAGAWAECFDDYDALLRYVVPQDRAMTTRPAERETVRDEIDLGIPLASCEPLEGEVASKAASSIVGSATPLSFRVPSVPFLFTGERYDRWA